MLNSLRGKLTFKNEEKTYILTGGIEWDIIISKNTFFDLPEVDDDCRIYTYLHHREDILKLFGFYTHLERALFLDLVKVEGVGPSLAMKILSSIKPEDFSRAIETEDMIKLTSIPGLGKKTAQKIVLKLAGKLSLTQKENPVHDDIVRALVGMGFDQKEARNAIKIVAGSLDGRDLSKKELEKEILKAVLQYLSKSEQ